MIVEVAVAFQYRDGQGWGFGNEASVLASIGEPGIGCYSCRAGAKQRVLPEESSHTLQGIP